MNQMLAVTLPIFLMLLTGFVSTKLQWVSANMATVLSQFIIRIALPCFLIHALSSQQWQAIWQPGYFFAYLIGSIILFTVVFIVYRFYLKQNRSHAAVYAFAGSMSNTGFIGTAVLTMLIADKAIPYLAMTLIIENIIMLTLMLSIAETGNSDGKTLPQLWLQTAKNLLKHPVIMSILIGLLASACGIRWPTALDTTLTLFSKTATPLAVFVIGANLVSMDVKSIGKDVWLVCGIKIILMPTIITALLYLIPNISAEARYAGLILAALPIASASVIYAQNYGISERIAPPVMISTLLSLISISIILNVVK